MEHGSGGAMVDKDGFRLRGVPVARIDAFSDVVFGFALTLLVVSLEVPKTYSELHSSLRGFVPFAISFLMLMLIWHAHYKYFRRYGTHDMGTVTINACLLFVVLFYVYPLKFLFTVFTYWIMGLQTEFFESQSQVRELMLIYGVGFIAIYMLLGGLYWNAFRQRAALDLNPLETLLTRSYVARMFGTALVGLVSCILAVLVPLEYTGLAGLTYMLISPVHRLVERWLKSKRASLLAPRLETTGG